MAVGGTVKATERYMAMVQEQAEQRARLVGDAAADAWAGPRARLFREDPRRALDPNLEALAAYVQPRDTVIDVGGGAGRVGLPLALRCREVITVEPSAGMAEQFRSLAKEAGIGNVQMVQAGWLEAPEIAGDVVLAAHVTYFVREIEPFVEKLRRAARRRVMLVLASSPPPNEHSALYQMAYGEPKSPLPGYAELLEVLWEQGVLPEMRTLPNRSFMAGGLPQTREDAVARAVAAFEGGDQEKLRRVIEPNVDSLYARTAEGYRPTWRSGERRELLITWETGRV